MEMTMPKFSERLPRLGTETAFEVLAKAKALEAQGRDIVHLQIGEPDFDTPMNIKERAVKAIMEEGYTHYTPSAGLFTCREKYAEYISDRYKIKVGPENIVITPGAKPVLFLSALAIIDTGDEVIYPNPGYPIYESVINFLGAKPMPIKLREQQDFRFDVDELKSLVTNKTRMMIINTPQNPTGGILTREDLTAIWELSEKWGFWVLSDEVYSRIVYEGHHESIMSLPNVLERGILLEGHSKTFAMTGWRLGFAVTGKELANWLTKLMVNANSCTAAFTQVAGVEALLGNQEAVEAMVREFRERRDLIVDGLNTIDGVRCLRPKGAFYVFPNFKAFGKDSHWLEEYLLQEWGVACLTGTAFGAEGKGYLRFSYANSKENIVKALDRIAKACEKLKVSITS